MRVHPISLALQFLRGRKSWHGRRLFKCESEAIDVLKQRSGQDFGSDASAWGKWLRANRWVYHASPDDPRLDQQT
jgi:hypothetical protein